MNKSQKYISTTELAKLLGISRIAVFKKIKSGEIKAERAGRAFIIATEDLPQVLGHALTNNKRKLIEASVKKTVHEYGETLKLLGQE